MNDSSAFDETTLKRMPQWFILLILVLLGLPYLGLSLGFDFGIHEPKLGTQKENFFIYSEVRGYFRHILVQSSGFLLAAVTVVLAFTRYKLRNDKIALALGLSILFSGVIEAIDTLFIDGLSHNVVEKNNLDALVSIVSSSMSGLLLLFSLKLILKSTPYNKIRPHQFTLLICCTLLTAMSTMYLVTNPINQTELWLKDNYISRPYEVISIGIYLWLSLLVYPKIYKKYPTMLSHGIFYMSMTQIASALYLMFLSQRPYDSAFTIGYFLNVVNYFIPCLCLIIEDRASYNDVLKLRQKLKVLQHAAAHDALTHLFNRREFEELLDSALSNAQRMHASLTLIMIDLDNFKAINDTYGHTHGDELLKQCSQRLVLLIGKGDFLSRVGSDEFTLISPSIESPSEARKQAARILDHLSKPYLINGKLITVTASIGIAIFPSDARTSGSLLIKLDLALNKAKCFGKNTYQFYTEELSQLQHRESEIEAHLRQALQNDEFSLSFQPKFNLLNNEVIGAEILLRWESKILGNPCPSEFIPVAERSGLMMELGTWVLNKSCQQLASWNKKYNHKLSFSINISPIQLANNQFLTQVKKNLAELNCMPENLEFEITETVLMNESDELAQVLNEVSRLGIKISLDDFGRGYSSLTRLKTLPIDTLKIDKYFISDIQNQHDNTILVDTIIKLASELGKNIIAEGIETKAQLDYLVSKNCYFGQGFLLSKPLTAEQFVKLTFLK